MAVTKSLVCQPKHLKTLAFQRVDRSLPRKKSRENPQAIHSFCREFPQELHQILLLDSRRDKRKDSTRTSDRTL